MSDESERVIALSTLTSAPAAACRSSFDTSALALSDMEQANIAYGRFYVRLELAADAFLARESAGEPPAALPPPSQPLAKRRTSRDLMAAMPGEQALGLDTLTAIPMDPPGGAVNRAATFVPRDPNDVPLDVLLPVKPAPPGERPAAQDSVQYVPDYRASTLGFPTLIGWQVAPPPDVPPEPPPVVAPALYLVQRHRLVTYARGFGLGPHVYSFTLLPDEQVEIEIKTWKSQEQIDKTGSSIFDGQSQSAESEFEQAVQRETSQSHKRDKESEAHVQASGEVSWGFGSASVEAGASRKTTDSTEQFAKDMSSATQKVANKANRERRVEMTQSSEVKTTEGEETRTKRVVKNINKCNTLNFHYFQLVRKYESRLELHDIRLRYASGRPVYDEQVRAWQYEAEEVPLSQIDRLLARSVTPGAAAEVRSAIFAMLGSGTDEDPGLNILTATSTPARMRLDTLSLIDQVAWEDAARQAARENLEAPARPRSRLPLLLSREERVIATNALYADAMMGVCSAADDFIRDSRVLEIEARHLENRERANRAARVQLENTAFQENPIPRRVVQFEGVPAGATIQLHEADARGTRPEAPITSDE